MNNLLTGVCNNIEQNIDKILLWKNSFEAVTNNDDVILVAYNPTGPDIKALEKHNIRYQGIRENSNETVNNMRLLPMADFLEDNKQYYNKVLYTDVFDVAFLKNPFLKITDEADIFVAGEGVLHREEPWNTDVMNKCFPSYTQPTKDQEVYCSGVIAGDIEVLSKYLRQMNTECLTSKKGHDIEDQAAMNIVIYKDIFAVKKFNLTDNWCIHMAVAGPTQFFEAWGFGDRIKQRYGLVPRWQDYDIVHQFNRTPEIHKILTKLYA